MLPLPEVSHLRGSRAHALPSRRQEKHCHYSTYAYGVSHAQGSLRYQLGFPNCAPLGKMGSARLCIRLLAGGDRTVVPLLVADGSPLVRKNCFTVL